MQQAIVELQTTGYSVSVVVATQNITVDGIMGVDVTISMTVTSVSVKERIVIFASEDWGLGWFFIFAGVDPGFTQSDAGMDAIVNSFTVEEKDGGGGLLSGTTAILIGVGVAVVVVVIVVLLLLMKKKPAPVAPFPGPPIPPEQPPIPPPPPGQ